MLTPEQEKKQQEVEEKKRELEERKKLQQQFDPSTINLADYDVKKVVILQRAIRVFLQKLHEEKRKLQRKNVANEIYESEIAYVSYVHKLLGEYYSPLMNAIKENKPILSVEQVKQIFSGLDAIIKLNENLLKDLAPIIVSWDDNSKVAPVLIKFAKFMKMYNQYCSGYDKARQLLNELRDNKQWQAFCRNHSVLSETGKPQTLESLLIMPVQRIPRYCLLLKELLKATPENHPDYGETVKALALFEETGTYVNEKQRESNATHTVRALDEMLYGNKTVLMENPARKFIGLYTVFMKKKQEKKRTLFLFNDVWLLADHTDSIEQMKEKLFVHMQWSLANTEVRFTEDDGSHSLHLFVKPTATCGNPSKRRRFLTSKSAEADASQSTPIVLYFADETTKDEAMEKICDLVDRLKDAKKTGQSKGLNDGNIAVSKSPSMY